MGYGLFQGLNEGYQSYRARERDIEDRNRRDFEDELRREAAERARAVEQRSQETYDYGVSRRPVTEKSQDLQLEHQELSFDEWKKNAPLRAEQNELELKTAKEQLRLTGLQIDDAELEARAKQQTKKYQDWGLKWMSGQWSMDDLVYAFNNDKNPDGTKDDTNDVVSVAGNEKTGWQIKMANGEDIFFPDRDAVGIHVHSMAEPAFHQRYLLQIQAQKAALAEAAAKAAQVTAKDLLPFQREWNDQVKERTDRYFGTMLKEGIIDFGTAGARDVAGDVAAVSSLIGQNVQYQGLNAIDVTRDVNALAKAALIQEPEQRRAKAVEFIEAAREADGLYKGKEIPKKDTEAYEDMVNQQMLDDYDRAYDQFVREAMSRHLQLDAEGNIRVRNYQSYLSTPEERAEEAAKADTIPTEGLERPQPESVESPSGREDMGLAPRVTPDPDNKVLQAELAAMERIKQSGEAAEQRRKTGKIKRQEQLEFAKQRAAQFGYKPRGKQTAEEKRKIKADFDQNFATMSAREQEMFFNSFSYALSAADRKKAKQIMAAS